MQSLSWSLCLQFSRYLIDLQNMGAIVYDLGKKTLVTTMRDISNFFNEIK